MMGRCEKSCGILQNIFKVNKSNDHIKRSIRSGKVTEDKERPVLITLKEENKK